MSDAAPLPKPIRRLNIAGNVALQVVAGVVLLGVVNYLSFRHFRRWDLTRDQQYSLSAQTQGLLAALKPKTEVLACFARGSDEEKEVRALLEEYKRFGRSRLVVEYLDLVREPSRREEMGKKYGLRLTENGLVVSKQVPPPKPKPSVDAASSPAPPPAPVAEAPPPAPVRRTRFVPAKQLFTYDTSEAQRRMTEFRGEDLLTSAVIGVNQKTPPVLYLLTSTIDDLPRATDPSGAVVTAQNVLWGIAAWQDVDVRTLSLTGQTELPADASAIVSLRPALDLTQREVDLIEEFWTKRKGVGLFFMLNPDADLPRLDSFLAKYGVRPRHDRVLKVLNTAQGIRKELEVPAAFNPEAAVTARLGGAAITFPEQTMSLRLEEDSAKLRPAGLEVTPLVIAGADYWGEVRHDDPAPRRDADDVGAPDPLFLAAAVERGALRDQRLTAASSRMVVVGNAALIDPARDTAKVSPSALDFVSSSLNWILNREELIGVAARRLPGYHLDLSPAHTAKILWLCLGLLPAAVITLAFAMWSARRV